MKRYALIGQGIRQSLSPIIHLAGARLAGQTIDYLLLEPASQEELATLVNELRAGTWDGFNVTTPFKTEIIHFIDECSSSAINTVLRRSDRIAGVSTDGEGFFWGLNFLNVDPIDLKEVVFLGSGGVVLSLIEHFFKFYPNSAKSIRFKSLVRDLHSESVKRLERFSKLKGISLDFETETNALKKTISPLSLLIEARPSRSLGVGECIGEFLTSLPRSIIYYDLNYQQKKSDSFNLAFSHFYKCIDGLPMLIEQARQAQILWWGSSVGISELTSAVLQELQAKQGS